ncbi:MAG TPA: STAS domain-containing protein [Gaiellaceae bacterium]|nr:STAS domain-containing protein [Gaiellaceae bacterium]
MSVLEFSVRTAEVGDNAFIITVTGEADLHTAPEIDRALHGVLGLGGTATAVDLADVSFVDSTALAILLRHQRRFRGRGGDLVIVTADRRVLRTFEITGLDRVFRIEKRLADGVAVLLSDSSR